MFDDKENENVAGHTGTIVNVLQSIHNLIYRVMKNFAKF